MSRLPLRAARGRGLANGPAVARRLWMLVLLTLLIGAGNAVGTPNAVRPPSTLDGAVAPAAVDRFVEEQMERHRIPGVSLALFEEGRIIYTAGYGKADRHTAMEPDTPMPAGSITKVITAVAILQLAEDGKISLDASVQTYLPWFTVADETAAAAITVQHLLQHTSGLSQPGYSRVLPANTSLEQGVRDLSRARLTAPVGSEFQYFNGNYSTLALIIEVVSGKRYGDFVRARILEPLGMDRSDATFAETRTAQGHSKLFGFPFSRNVPPFKYLLGAGHLTSTAPDLARLAVALDNNGAYGDVRILSPASVDLMRTPPPGNGASYGMGWEQREHRGASIGGHNGGDPTFMGQVWVHDDAGRGYVLLMNQEHLIDAMVIFPQLTDGMLALLRGQPAPVPGPSVSLIGAVLLVAFLVSIILTARDLTRLRGWTARSRAMPPARLASEIGRHFAVPALIVAAVYLLPPLFLHERFTVDWAGRYYLPDILLLLIVATVPDVLQGLYLLATAIAQRWPYAAVQEQRGRPPVR